MVAVISYIVCCALYKSKLFSLFLWRRRIPKCSSIHNEERNKRKHLNVLVNKITIREKKEINFFYASTISL